MAAEAFVRKPIRVILSAHDSVKIDWVESGSGLILPRDVAEKSKRPKGMDLFSGCGGFSLGLIQAGFEVVAAADNEIYGTLTYLDNLGNYPMQFWWVEPEDEARMEKALQKHFFPRGSNGKEIVEATVCGSGWLSHHPEFKGVSNFFFGDIRKLTGRKILDSLEMERGELDCVFGGPPCQGFSIMGKRNIMDPRNSLVFEFIRLVVEIQPKTMIFENVPGIVNMVTPEGVPVIDAMCRILEKGEFGEYDSLRRSLLSHPDARTMYKGQGKKKAKQKKKSKVKAKSEALMQPTLFG